MALSAPPIQNNNPLLQPNVPLSGNSLYQAAVALAKAQTQPQLDQLASAIAQNNAQAHGAEQLTSGYFNQLGNFANQSATNVGNIGTNLSSTLRGIGQNEQQSLQGIGNDAQGMLAKYTPGMDSNMRGAGVQSLTEEIARQQGLASQGDANQQGYGAILGALNSQHAAALPGVFAQRGQDTLSAIARDNAVGNQKLQAQRQALISNYGNTVTKDLTGLRQQQIANAFTSSGLGIKQTSANAALTSANASAANARTNAANSKIKGWDANPNNVGSSAWARVQSSQLDSVKAANQNQDYTWQHMDRLSAQRLKATSGAMLPTARNNQALKALLQIGNTIGYYQQKGIPGKSFDKSTGKFTNVVNGYSEQAARQALSSLDPTGGALIQAAYELLGYGSINQSTAADLQAHGVDITPYRFRGNPVKITQDYQISQGAQNTPH